MEESRLPGNVTIRPLTPGDWPAVWAILEPVFRAGETYPHSPEITEGEARKAWIDAPRASFVAVAENGGIVGSYYLKPNQPGLGAHVCNCGYAVAGAEKGRGIATAMCLHSQQEARTLGFRAMQFNLVVASNERAVRLWQHLGFRLVGTLPGAFRHRRLGFVDAFVMYRELV